MWAGDLVPGDQLLGEDGQEVTVESIAQTEQFEKVYNLRVADNHTYFVGSDGWGFIVWVHNANCIQTPNGYILLINKNANWNVSQLKPAIISNIRYLDASVNTSMGASIKAAMAGLNDGTKILRVRFI